SILIDEKNIPVKEAVTSLCEMFGFDPLFIANEGKVIITVRPSAVDMVISIMRKHPYGKEAAVIGKIEDSNKKIVTLKTLVGGTRIVTVPAGDQLPRIC
ncbi:MAG: AIR synthase-related protein, partial [Chitinispirillaceae bacterium]|nr:AIR synthase-related protein [Chitinispirillaceae bacterium]